MRSISVLLGILAFCGIAYAQIPKSAEERATTLVQEALPEELFVRSSYKSLEMKLDSAFSPFDRSEYFDKLVEVNRLGFKAVAMYKVKDRLQKLISLYESKSPQAKHITKQTYQKTQARHSALTDSLNLMTEQSNILRESVIQASGERPKFIGFRARHSYKVVDREGQIVTRKQYILYNKDITEIIASYNLDHEEVERTLSLIEIIRDKETVPSDEGKHEQ